VLAECITLVKLCTHRGIARGRAGGSIPPQLSIEWIFFAEANWLYSDCSLYQKCSVGLKYAKNALATWAPLRTLLGELTMHPQTL